MKDFFAKVLQLAQETSLLKKLTGADARSLRTKTFPYSVKTLKHFFRSLIDGGALGTKKK